MESTKLGNATSALDILMCAWPPKLAANDHFESKTWEEVLGSPHWSLDNCLVNERLVETLLTFVAMINLDAGLATK